MQGHFQGFLNLYKFHVEIYCGWSLLGVERQQWVRRKWGLACWLTSNPPGLLKRLLLEFNHPAIPDTLGGWAGWWDDWWACSTQTISVNSSRSCNQRFGWMSAIQWWGNRISFEKSNLTLFFPLFTLPISLKTGSHLLLNNCFVKPLDYNCKWYLKGQRKSVLLLVIFHYLTFLKVFATMFSISQQARLLVFIMHHLFLDKGPILLSAKQKAEHQWIVSRKFA